MKLIVGVGNPGPQYRNHRHNVGFMALDRVHAREHGSEWREKHQGLVSQCVIAGRPVVLLKPQTYMNVSGSSVVRAAQQGGVKVGEVLVVHDELELPFGEVRAKQGGGLGGHNGLRSIHGVMGADFARIRAGLSYVFWEPMSVGREFGETIAEAMALQARLTAAGMAVPMWMMADIDHGDVTSPNPDDTDPYAWARAVPKVSPIIHIKQSMMDKSGHRPFTAAFNAKGSIQPAPLLAALAEGGAVDNEICLELSFKEREPNDRQVVAQIAESVAFWAPHIDSGAADLHI